MSVLSYITKADTTLPRQIRRNTTSKAHAQHWETYYTKCEALYVWSALSCGHFFCAQFTAQFCYINKREGRKGFVS